MKQKTEFNLEGMGRQMPYTTPDNFLAEIEQKAWSQLQQEQKSGRRGSTTERIIIGIRLVAAVAASVLLLISLYNAYTKEEAVRYDDVEQAFMSLCEADQDYLLDIYACELGEALE